MCRSQAFSLYWRLLLENWKRCEKEYLVRLRIPAWSLNAVGVSSKAIGCGTAVTIFVNPLWTPRSGSISTLYLFENKILNTLRHQIIATIAKIVRIRRRNKVRLRGNFQKNKVRIRTKIVRIQKMKLSLLWLCQVLRGEHMLMFVEVRLRLLQKLLSYRWLLLLSVIQVVFLEKITKFLARLHNIETLVLGIWLLEMLIDPK